MEYMKTILLIMYVATGIGLIGIALFKKIKVNEGEVIEKFKEYKAAYMGGNIFFGILFLTLAYFFYKNNISGWILVVTVPIVELLQRVINNYYIKDIEEVEVKEGKTELSEEINIDEILKDDFFEEKRKLEITQEEHLEKNQPNNNEDLKLKNQEIVNTLFEEGVNLGIFPKDLFDILNNSTKKQEDLEV